MSPPPSAEEWWNTVEFKPSLWTILGRAGEREMAVAKVAAISARIGAVSFPW
jgi:hypothetical protein